MQGGYVTTPFGRRPVSLALVRRQVAATEVKPGKSVDKWKVFRNASEARERLGLQDRSLAVLDALLSFHPDNELREDAQLIVFPSNAQLALRAHGIAGATLRRHLALLVEAGLILRRDSANGKRYARKDKAGGIESAFGFDLSPLLARDEELAGLAQQIIDDRLALRRAREDMTICRRDVRKLITAAMEEGIPGDWDQIEATYIGLVSRIPRTPTHAETIDMLSEMDLFRRDVVKQLELHQNSQNNSSNAAHNEQHKQNSNTESLSELERLLKKRQGGRSVWQNEPPKTFPLGLVLRACPEISAYGPSGALGSWRELMTAAVAVRSMLGVSPSAYQAACDVMGPETAAATMACILERAGHINSPGGYLRDLTSRAERGEFSLGPVLMALLKGRGDGGRRTG